MIFKFGISYIYRTNIWTTLHSQSPLGQTHSVQTPVGEFWSAGGTWGEQPQGRSKEHTLMYCCSEWGPSVDHCLPDIFKCFTDFKQNTKKLNYCDDLPTFVTEMCSSQLNTDPVVTKFTVNSWTDFSLDAFHWQMWLFSFSLSRRWDFICSVSDLQKRFRWLQEALPQIPAGQRSFSRLGQDQPAARGLGKHHILRVTPALLFTRAHGLMLQSSVL